MDAPEPQTWFNGLATLVVGFFVWIWNKHVTRVEAIENAQDSFVTHEQFNQYLEREREDRKNDREDRVLMHKDNTDGIRGLRDDVRAVHARIDQGMK